jgi:protein-tyrosine-phosphatase
VTKDSEHLQERGALVDEAEKNLRNRLLSSLKATAKSLLPETVVKEVQRYRAFTGRERPIYLRKRALNAVGLERPSVLPFPGTVGSVVFVCFGNIIRSPMCEALLIRELATLSDVRVAVSSAGLHALPGRPAHPWAVAAAREFGVSLEGHRARLLTEQMLVEGDAIFAMDYQNQVELLSRWPAAKEKVHMLSAYAGKSYRSVEIPDPYNAGSEETIKCYRVLKTCIEHLARSISRSARTTGG